MDEHPSTSKRQMVAVTLDRMWRTVLVNRLAASPMLVNQARAALLRLYGIHTATHGIRPGCFFAGRNVSFGPGTFVNYRCYFDGSAPIRIGSRCSLGMEVLFCTSTHVIGTSAERAGAPDPRPITVGDGCWIGARSVILPGVTIGEGCIIAAGAVVNKDCAPNGMYAGVPARRIKDLP